MAKSESAFQKQCIDLLKNKGCYVYKNAQSEFTEKGRPDLTVCIPVDAKTLLGICKRVCEISTTAKLGLFVGLELKREGHKNEVSLAQKVVAKQIEKAGGHWYLVDNLNELKQILTKYAIQ